MGWFERDWYLGPHKAQLFDTNGNAGPTAWWNGRIVGGWRQTDTGEVELQLLEDVGTEGRRALEDEAARLTEWLAGTRVVARFPSPLSKQIARNDSNPRCNRGLLMASGLDASHPLSYEGCMPTASESLSRIARPTVRSGGEDVPPTRTSSSATVQVNPLGPHSAKYVVGFGPATSRPPRWGRGMSR